MTHSISTPLSSASRALFADRLALARDERARGTRRSCDSRRSASGTAGRCAGGSRARRQAAIRLAREEGDVQRRDAEPRRRPEPRAGNSSASRSCCVGAGPDQQALPRHRRERDGGLQLGIIAAAGALIGVGPAMIEHVLALAVRFQIAGHAADQRAACVLEHKMLRQPAGLGGGRAAVLQRLEKGVRDERVIGSGASIPGGGRHLVDARDDAQQDGLARVSR